MEEPYHWVQALITNDRLLFYEVCNMLNLSLRAGRCHEDTIDECSSKINLELLFIKKTTTKYFVGLEFFGTMT